MLNINAIAFVFTRLIHYIKHMSSYKIERMHSINIIQQDKPNTLAHGELVHGKIGYQYFVTTIEDPDIDTLMSDTQINCIPISNLCLNPFDFFMLPGLIDNAPHVSSLFVYEDKINLPDNQARRSVCVCPSHYLTHDTTFFSQKIKGILGHDILAMITDIQSNRINHLPTSMDTPNAIQHSLLGSGLSDQFSDDGVSILGRCLIALDNGDKILAWTWIRHFT